MIRTTFLACLLVTTLGLGSRSALAETYVLHLDEWVDGHCTICGGS